MAEPEPTYAAADVAPTRYHAFDSVRAVMMLLGIYLHAVVAYAPIGGWPYKQPELTSALNFTVILIHVFRMPVFYVMAGFFAALLYDRRGFRLTVENRVWRILIPFVVGWCIIFPLSLAMGIWLPAALLMAVVDRRFSAAFEFGRIWNFIKGNAGNYALAWVTRMIAGFIAQFGILLLCIGVVFTGFWALCIGAFAFAQVYRLSKVR